MPNQWSSAKHAMDVRRDLGVHRKNGGEEQKGLVGIHQNSSSVQGRQPYFQQSQWTSKTNNTEGEWGHDHYCNSTRCCLLLVHDQSTFLKENKGEDELTISAPRPNLSMDDCNGAQSQKATIHNQRFLEIKSGKDCQLCIWCISYRMQSGGKGQIMYTPASERQLSSSSGLVWKGDSDNGVLGVRELRGDECLDFFMPVETRPPDRVSNNDSIQKENDREFREFHGPTDEWLIDQEYREYFNETYRITNIYPLLMDHSGTVMFFLDDRGILFAWCEMTKEMDILGINKIEGLANYLYHPEKVCSIMEDTGELVPRVELKRRVKEEMAKEKLAEKSKEKKIGRGKAKVI
ncbi:9374_t:CDS:2 [Funneliformis caledonium]|uniref:9374_t:CDS:1 n=1 Tax=Funneliformis caledonium TaxID=1117310 RepID=A0A9N9DTC9_9GLOM|nr:9374_t:CDS:2 [Funneliformis caledonium]